MAGLDRDHINNNLLDQVAELQRRLDGLERSALRGTIGPYEPDETTTITGYLNLLIHEEGIPTPYRLAIAETYATDPIPVDVNISGVIPIGGIIGWSGSVNNVPTHWNLCDGSNGTPDMRDRFVVGAGSTYAVGATGGAATVDASHDHADGTLAAAVGAHHHHNSTLAADSDSHSHGYGTIATGNDTHDHDFGESSGTMFVSPGGTTYVGDLTFNSDTHNHSVSGSTASVAHTHTVSGEVGAVQGASTGDVSGSTATGGSATENNLPPYYAWAWIMRAS
jgi:hypothetical protein